MQDRLELFSLTFHITNLNYHFRDPKERMVVHGMLGHEGSSKQIYNVIK